MCYPREGNLDAVYCIFRYLQNNLGNNIGRMIYDPMYESTDENVFEVVGIYLNEWKGFYPAAQEMITRYIMEALGKYILIKDYVDDIYKGNMNMVNRSSYYGIIIYVTNKPIILYSICHNTVET